MIQDYTKYVSGNEFLNKNADIKTVEKDFDFNSFYRARVIDNNDPERLGRVKIQLPARHPNGGACPWAYPACFTGLGFQTGMFVLPPIGATVFVTFEYSDEHRPIYFGGIPTKVAEDKTQSYGPFINGGNERIVFDDDLPLEYTGTQQIIYKSPTGSIFYFDSSDMNNVIVLKNIIGSQFKIGNEYKADTTENNYIEMKYDDNNYFIIKENEVHLIINGQEVEIGGGGSGEARTVIWDD